MSCDPSPCASAPASAPAPASASASAFRGAGVTSLAVTYVRSQTNIRKTKRVLFGSANSPAMKMKGVAISYGQSRPRAQDSHSSEDADEDRDTSESEPECDADDDTDDERERERRPRWRHVECRILGGEPSSPPAFCTACCQLVTGSVLLLPSAPTDVLCSTCRDLGW